MPSLSKFSSAGFVLTGGKSSRMGTEKALLEFRGRTLLERALDTVRVACGEVSIAGDAEKFASYGRVIADLYPGCGPLAGIHAALLSSPAELNLMLAVDMPLVSPELLGFILAEASSSDAIVVVPRTHRGFQPLCAVYRRAVAAVAEDALRAGRYKIDALFPEVAIRTIEEDKLKRSEFPERMFLNVNTLEDLSAAHNDK